MFFVITSQLEKRQAKYLDDLWRQPSRVDDTKEKLVTTYVRNALSGDYYSTGIT